MPNHVRASAFVYGGDNRKLDSANRNTWIMFFSILMVGMGFSIIMPVLPFYVTSLGANAFQLGMLITVYALCQFIFAPIWGNYSDRVGRRPVLIMGVIGFAITFILMGLSTRLWMLFAARILGGILSCAALPTAMAYVGDTTSDEKRGSTMGLVGASMGMGMIFGPAIGGLLSGFSIALPFFCAGGLAALNSLMVILWIKESLPPEKRTEQREVIIVPPFWDGLKSSLVVFFIVIFMVSTSEAIHQGTFALFINGRLGFGAREVSMAFVAAGVGSVLVQGLLVGRIMNRMGEEKTARMGIITMALSFALFLNAFSLWSIILFMAMYSAGIGMIRPSITTAVSRRTELQQGKSMGILQGFDSLGRVIGPALGGFLLDIHLNFAYTAAISILVVAMVVLLLYIRRRSEEKIAESAPKSAPD